MPAKLESGKPAADRRALARTISARYPTPFLRHYTYWKIVTDPVYGAVWDVLASAPSLPLLDLGCGAGLLAFYLREHGFAPDISGLDLDGPKIEAAAAIAREHDLRAEFRAQDFRDAFQSASGHVTLLDVLQFVPERAQREILARAASFVHPEGGLLIIRTGIRDDSMRFRITHFMDIFARVIGWMKAPPVDYPTPEMFREVLEPAGFRVELRPLWGRTPFNNYLVIARR